MACETGLLSVRREGNTAARAMLVPGLADRIALAGTSHGPLLDHAYSGHRYVATALGLQGN